MNARAVFDKLVEQAYWFPFLHPGRTPGRIGEAITRLPEDERKALQELTSADALNVRNDWAGHVGVSGKFAYEIGRRRNPYLNQGRVV